MLMSRVILFMLIAAVLFGALSGRISTVAAASVAGAESAVSLLLRIGGTVCLWNGLLEVMSRSGLSKKVARLLKPIISLLFGRFAKDAQAAEYISQNMAANLLGLGSAATPSGLRAAKRLFELEPAGHQVFLLIVLNTASLQLLPTTVAAVRAACGSQKPYSILPAVWLASLVSIVVGVSAAKLLRRLHK